METTIDISNTKSIIGFVVEYDCAEHNPHSAIVRHGTTITFILTQVLLEVGEYGGVCAVLVGETEDEELVRFRLHLEGLKALLEGNAYACNTTLFNDPEFYKSETFEIIS